MDNNTAVTHPIVMGTTKKDHLIENIWFLVFGLLWTEAKHYGYLPLDVINEQRWVHPEFLQWLRELRTVSKDFNDIITPLSYEMVRLTQDKASLKDPKNVYQKSKENVLQYSQKLLFRSHPSRSYLNDVLLFTSNCQRLVLIEWSTVGDDDDRKTICMSACLQEFLKRSPRCVIADDYNRFSMMACEEDGSMMKRRVIDSTISQDLIKPAGIMEQKVQSSDVGTKCTILDIHSSETSTSGFCFHNPNFQRLPAMRTLNLVEQCWVHTERSFSKVWDFSALDHLNLSWINFDTFLRMIPADQLVNLSTFELQHYGGSTDSEDLFEIADLLQKLIVNFKKLTALKLTLDCWLDYFGLELIVGLGDNLQRLSLRNFSLPEGATGHIDLSGLELLRTRCLHLYELKVDLPQTQSDHESFLKYISTINTLTKVGFYVHGGFEAAGVDKRQNTDPDYDGAFNILKFFDDHQCGNLVKEMIVHGHNCGRAQATGQYFMGVEERDFELHYHDNGGSVRGGSDRFTEFALPWHRNSDVDYTRRDDEQEEHNEGDSSEQALIRWEDFSVLVEDTDDDDDEGDWEDESDEGDGEDADVEEGDEDVNENEEPIDGGETDAE